LLTLLGVYGAMIVAGVVWLSWRQRTAVIGEWSMGTRGPFVAVATGTGTGVVFFVIGRLLVRYAPPFARLDAKLADLIGPVAERDAVAIALVSGAAEEFFFRCAMQDALGVFAAAGVFALAHLGGRSVWLWSAQAGVFGLALGGLVHFGCGVLAAALAHAVFNYLWLQRTIPR
jgi:membrane protease YdiL (CAAX protease family)